MRIITGQYRGRRLKTLEGLAVRPTSDRLRETIFNILAPRIAGARFADLCAGSGAVGIEALSRGAAEVVFAEQSPKAAAIIRENLAHCGIESGYRVINRPLAMALRYFVSEQILFDIIYFDPPYDSLLYAPVVREIGASRLLADDGLLIVEHHRTILPPPGDERLRPYREITQGETRLTFYQMEAVIPSDSVFVDGKANS